MAKPSLRAAIKHDRPQARVSPDWPGESRVDAGMNLPPPAAFEVPGDCPHRHARREYLLTGDDASLQVRQFSQAARDLVLHAAEYDGRFRQSASENHDRVNFSELSLAEINTKKKVNTIMAAAWPATRRPQTSVSGTAGSARRA